MLAPIALFVYNRPEHLKKTITALKLNRLSNDSELFVFSDGYKNDKDKLEVEAVRILLNKADGFKKITVIKRQSNFGLAKSIIRGVTETVNKFGKIIVIEDDLIVSSNFLEYMNKELDFYENDEEVISVHGYVYPIIKVLPETFFLKGADCWGWATWKRGWNLFESDGKKLLAELRNSHLTKEFDFDGLYPYAQMLEEQTVGYNDSWAIRWYASAFLKNKLTLYPGNSLVKNIGFDGSGRHSGSAGLHNGLLSERKINFFKIVAQESIVGRQAFVDYFKSPRIRIATTVMRLKHYWKMIKYGI
jgi:hypothetical protein